MGWGMVVDVVAHGATEAVAILVAVGGKGLCMEADLATVLVMDK
jgi:hypothetical protein